MSGIDYFLNSENWSLPGLLLVVVLGVGYCLSMKSSRPQNIYFSLMLLLFYIGFGSPLSDLTNFGLHSVSMLQHIVLLMMAPVLLLKAIPKDSMVANVLAERFNKAQNYFVYVWLLAAIAMWGGHFLSAAVHSSQLGTAICGISVPASSWVSNIPLNAIAIVLFIIGFFGNLPVFHPNPKSRLRPAQSVVYLFTSCIVCSVLGLYVAFSAVMMDATPVFTTLRNPVNISVRTDQELAGMLMWVPGCVLYVMASVEIVVRWLGGNESVAQETEAIRVLK